VIIADLTGSEMGCIAFSILTYGTTLNGERRKRLNVLYGHIRDQKRDNDSVANEKGAANICK
jgi:hypothetical protein